MSLAAKHYAGKHFSHQGAAQKMIFCHGVVEMADAIAENRPGRMAADVSLQNNEFAIAIQDSLATGAPYRLTTTFEAIQPMAWSK